MSPISNSLLSDVGEVTQDEGEKACIQASPSSSDTIDNSQVLENEGEHLVIDKSYEYISESRLFAHIPSTQSTKLISKPPVLFAGHDFDVDRIGVYRGKFCCILCHVIYTVACVCQCVFVCVCVCVCVSLIVLVWF